ncbi:MAG: acyl-CoA dehydrogenase [Rickettsiaceae bacterium]|jgi:alkylation response protein AidB-like acyl-CoA dehydrogenase|nr:acyl-CoA dehydrogenase [Rickettsiaceae bacterium]
MADYHPPLEDIKFILNEVLGLDNVLKLDKFSGFSGDLVDAILTEAARFAAEKLAPLNATGDKQGCSKAHDGIIETPEGFKQAYAEFVANGWNSVPFPQEEGGQGLPWLVSVAISEMWSGANMAFALCPLLTQGSVDLLLHHGSAEQKEKYLKKLISGEWTGTMCLTEAKAGSDVGAVKTTATKSGDHYLIKGQKIFITYGEHDLTGNIIHMVLAKTPGAPAGVKGISLFIVPKILEDGKRNDVWAISIEHKLGIHASPTAVLNFGDNEGAIGYLIGEENRGLNYMFTMMNNARLAVGIEGIAIAENSYQKALLYANERDQSGKPIINHPDVKRMLLTIKANTEAMRVLAYYTAKCIDLSNRDTTNPTSDLQETPPHIAMGDRYDEKWGEGYKNIVDILIPVVKAHSTDLGFEMSSLALQVFGGMGYIEEAGVAQNLRDSRIAMIYEGTNGIQALDLVMRKILMNEGALFASLQTDVKELYNGSIYEDLIHKSFARLEATTKFMRQLAISDREKAGFIAVYYLKMFGIIMGAVMMAAEEKAASKGLKENVDKSIFYNDKLETVKFYMDYILPEAEYFDTLVGRRSVVALV